MRGHWISTTRKLNRHYQSGGKPPVISIPDYNLFTVTSITYGIDDILNEVIAGPPTIPARLANAEKFEYKIYAKFNNGTGNLYILYMRLLMTFEDAEGVETSKEFAWCGPNWEFWTPREPLAGLTQFTNLYGNTDTGDKFILDTDTGLLTPTTRFIIDKSDLGVTGQKLKKVTQIGLFMSDRLTSPTTATLTNRVLKIYE